jgi:LPXTG-site transpeptidase (sortase) family protein
MLRRAAVPALTVVLLALASGVSVATPRGAVFAPRLAAPGSSIAAPSVPAVDSSQTAGVIDLKPARLLIPKIALDAKIESRGLDAKRNLDTPADPNDAAWYDLGPAPGQPGNAILNGHVDWWTGDAVFTHLGRMRPGDTVEVVRGDGQVVTFRVTSLQRVAANARIPSLFSPSADSTLTLITCMGVWNPITLTDSQRLIVSAAFV